MVRKCRNQLCDAHLGGQAVQQPLQLDIAQLPAGRRRGRQSARAVVCAVFPTLVSRAERVNEHGDVTKTQEVATWSDLNKRCNL